MKCCPPGFGGNRPDPEDIKRDGWQNMGTLVVNVSDARLSWPEQEMIRQLGEKLYGEKERKHT